MNADGKDLATSEAGGLWERPASSDYAQEFRAVKVGSGRRGIRLEHIYWQVLKEITGKQKRSLGDFVAEASGEFPDASNITSVLRVKAARWLWQELQDARSLTSAGVIDGLVQASPAPAFALGEDKRILAYNQAFLNYIQSRFSRFSSSSFAGSFRLSLDVQFSDLAETLRKSPGRPFGTGFVIGFDDQRLRGRLSTILGPSSGQITIIGYVAS